MLFSNKIRLFWWNEKKLQGKTRENYGDLLGKYLVEKISKKKVLWSKPSNFSFLDFFSPVYVTIGSILTNVNKKCIVWGSGIISKDCHVKDARFLAVRGPQTRAFLLDKGYNVPEVYGDPAILLPQYYNPDIKKAYKIGIVPHYSDYKFVNSLFEDEEDILIIDLMTNNIEETTDLFLKCEKIVSSSLHGIIIGHTYQIPAIWQKFSNNVFGDDIKYQDYFESVGIKPYQSKVLAKKLKIDELLRLFDHIDSLPDEKKMEDLRKGLMGVCPFKN